MGTLKGRSIASGYKNILQSSSEITNSDLKRVESGAGITTSMRLSTTAAEFQKIGIGTSGVTPDGLLHILSVSAGSVTANSAADEVVLENVGSCGLSILSGASGVGNLFFGDTNDNDVGKISYDHSTDSINFSTNGVVSMTLDKSSNLSVGGTISQSEDRYQLSEYFHNLPYRDIQDTEVNQDTDATTPVTSHTKITRITTQSHDLAASDTVEFVFNNDMIHVNSHVLAYIINSSGTVADNAMVNVMVTDVANGSCKIRLGTNATNIDAQTFEVQVMVDPHINSNDHWALDGTNINESYVRYAGTQPGFSSHTEGGDNDQIILHPKISNQGTDTDLNNVSPWRNVNFTSQYQPEINVAVSTYSNITNMSIWAGMKATDVGDYATDTDQAYFLYATDDDMGALTTNGNWHFVYSIGGVDYITDLGVTVVASTVYRLKLAFDENRQISVYINNIRYGLTSATTAGGVTQSIPTTKSLAMTSGSAIVPVVGMQALAAEVKYIYCHFIKASRTLA